VRGPRAGPPSPDRGAHVPGLLPLEGASAVGIMYGCGEREARRNLTPAAADRVGWPANERRKEGRRAAVRAAWIALQKGGELQECFMWNESPRGAKLTVDRPADLPDTFYLYFSIQFGWRRHCQVIWRSGDKVGVEFL
jgi:hypothetical protein